MELLIIALFGAEMLALFFLGIPTVYSLIIGYGLFFGYGVLKGASPWQLFRDSLKGVLTLKNIILTFFFIGAMTSLWRAAGTIPYIVCLASKLITPSLLVPASYILCLIISFLLGSSFASAATIGVICASVGSSLGLSAGLVGGAVMSGIFFGDRCSPVSTSALLIAELTKSNIYDNLKRMAKTAAVPTAVSLLLYFLFGLGSSGQGSIPDLFSVFGTEFKLGAVCLVPAAVIIAAACFQVPTKSAMALSIISAVPICIFRQGLSVKEVLYSMAAGFTPKDASLSAMISGGGIRSFVSVMFIVAIAGTYPVIFEKTGLLLGVQAALKRLGRKLSRFGASAVCACAASMLSSSQTLAVVLTHQLIKDGYENGGELAVDLEDTAIVLAPLVPWSIAGAVPLAAIGAPKSAYLYSFFLYLLPLFRLVLSLREKKNKEELN